MANPNPFDEAWNSIKKDLKNNPDIDINRIWEEALSRSKDLSIFYRNLANLAVYKGLFSDYEVKMTESQQIFRTLIERALKEIRTESRGLQTPRRVIIRPKEARPPPTPTAPSPSSLFGMSPATTPCRACVREPESKKAIDGCQAPWAPMAGRLRGKLCWLECGGAGDCLFHTIATALTIFVGRAITFQNIRNEAARVIQPHNVAEFVQHAALEKLADDNWPRHPDTWDPYMFGDPNFKEFEGSRVQVSPRYDPRSNMFSLDPDLVQWPPQFEEIPPNERRFFAANYARAKDIQNIIRTPGWKYIGDTLLLSTFAVESKMLRQLSVGFVIVLPPPRLFQCLIYPNTPRDNYILLYHLPGHWKLAGLANHEGGLPTAVVKRETLKSALGGEVTLACGERNFLS